MKALKVSVVRAVLTKFNPLPTSDAQQRTLNPNPPYPSEPPMMTYPTPLGVPNFGQIPANPPLVPVSPPSPSFPGPHLAMGSAWTSGPSAPPDPRPPVDTPPPPYPGIDPVPPYIAERCIP